MDRKMPQIITLEEALRDHVSYEIDMLNETFDRLGKPVGDSVMGNALIESFCIHARNLIDFLGNEDGGLRASSYVDAQYAHAKHVGVGKALYQKLSTQIAHLGQRRTSNNQDKINTADRRTLLETVSYTHLRAH